MAVHVVSEPDHGIYDALNKGIAAATGDVVGLMHCDNFFFHDRVLTAVAAAFETPGIDALYGDLDYFFRQRLCPGSAPLAGGRIYPAEACPRLDAAAPHPFPAARGLRTFWQL